MKFSFRAMLLALLLALVLGTVISLAVSGHVTTRATARDLTLKVLDQTSLVIDREVQGLLRKADDQGDCARRMFQAGALQTDDPVGLVRYFRALMESSPNLTGIFFGTEPLGECLGLSRLKENRLIVWELRKNPAT